MRDDQAKRFEEREARLGDEIARRWSRIPRPRAAGPSLLPSTGPTFAEDLARALASPGPRSKTRRSITATGATSFHIRVTSVVTSGASQAPDGSRSSSDRAARHQIYIERPAAVERLTPFLPRIADLPQQQIYIERVQAVELDGEAASFGNCGRTLEERIAFFKAVEISAHPARSFAVATCDRNHEPAFWRAVSDDPTAPACLKALEGPGPHKLKFKTEAEAAPVIAFADRHGEGGPDAKSERAIMFSPGRASRIQTRIILELPYELTPKQRLRLAKRICRELFGERQIRYWAAIHAPDAHNNARNFHLHVVFSDRPARKVRDKSGQRVWDFTILEMHEDKANRNKRWRRPYQQNRDRTFSARRWIKQTRERVAEFVNDALAEAGVERRVDPRRYSEMGINREPEPRAPAWAYSQEKRGVETAAARPAIEAQWERARQRLSQRYDNFQPDAGIAARFESAFRRAHERIDATWRLDTLVAGEQWRSAVERLNAAEADAAALQFNLEKARSRLAPPIEAGGRRANEVSLATLATIEAELLAEIRQQAAVAAAAEARALVTLAKFEKELGVSAEQLRLGAGIEGHSSQPVSARVIAISGIIDGATRSVSPRSIADGNLWTFPDQCAALRARALAVAGSSALAYANINDTVAARQQRASPSQFDDLDLPDHHSGLPLPMAGTVAQSRSAPDPAHHRQIDRRRNQEAETSGDMNVVLTARGLALSAASAATDCELASAFIALARQRQPAFVELELPPVVPKHTAVDAAERLHDLNIVAALGAEPSAQHEPRHDEIRRQSDIVAADQFLEVAARTLALRASGAALAAELKEHEASQSLRQRAIAAEATTAGDEHLQTGHISSTLAPILPSIAGKTEQWRHRQRRRDRQREHDDVLGDEELANRARALALRASAGLAAFAITADETSLNLARRAAFGAGRANASAQQEPRHGEIRRQSDVVVADQFLEIAARALALRATGAALAAKPAEHDASESRRRPAAAAEAAIVGGEHLQAGPISSALAPTAPSSDYETEETRRRQRLRDCQRQHDDIAGDEGLANRARALTSSSSGRLAELAITAVETYATLAHRTAFAAERAAAVELAQFDETTDFAANAANGADITSAQEEEHADERPSLEYDLGADRSANRRDDRSHSGATRDDEQVAKESDGRARKSAGADEDAERTTTARGDLGGASNLAGGDPARVLGESRSATWRSDVQAHREMRPMSPSGGGVRGVGASSGRQTDQPAFAGVSDGTQVSAGSGGHDVQPVSANVGRTDSSYRSTDQPSPTSDELRVAELTRIRRRRDMLRGSVEVGLRFCSVAAKIVERYNKRYFQSALSALRRNTFANASDIEGYLTPIDECSPRRRRWIGAWMRELSDFRIQDKARPDPPSIYVSTAPIIARRRRKAGLPPSSPRPPSSSGKSKDESLGTIPVTARRRFTRSPPEEEAPAAAVPASPVAHPATASQASRQTDTSMASTTSAATTRHPTETLADAKATFSTENRPAHVAQTGLDRVAPVEAATDEASGTAGSPAAANGQNPALPIEEGPIIPIGGRPYWVLQRNPPGRER
jgi:hypothetical protein